MFHKLKLALATTLALAIVPVATLAAHAASPEHKPAQARGGHAGFGFGGPLAKDLKLTDAQKSQLKAIAQKHRAERKQGDRKGQRQQLKTLLTAPKVDGAALRSFLNARAGERDANAAKRAAMMSEMRAVLTPEQRAQLVKSLNARADKAGKRAGERAKRFEGKRQGFGDRMVADLKLTADQKAKYDALQAKIKAQRADAAGRQAGKQAFVRFIETGDAAAFQASMKANRGQLPVNELVALAESLDQTQRQKLLKKFDRFMGGHGPKGGRGHR